MKADTLSNNFQGVTVDDVGTASDVSLGLKGKQSQEEAKPFVPSHRLCLSAAAMISPSFNGFWPSSQHPRPQKQQDENNRRYETRFHGAPPPFPHAPRGGTLPPLPDRPLTTK
jgi:hypothetical protein